MATVGMLGFCCILSICVLQHADAGQVCASCSNVGNASACNHIMECRNDEVCYLHKYSTESGLSMVDLGCTTYQGCPHSQEAILGKRAEGHHLKCTSCCNDTSRCNARMDCNTALNSGLVLPEECSDLTVPRHVSGVYTIYPYQTITKPVSVYCYFDTNNIAWTVIQKRFNGSVNFTRDWASYKEGFGTSDGEFWLGNDIIHEMTYHQNHVLRIDMEDVNGTRIYAEYSSFRIADESRLYQLAVFGYTGTAGDALVYDSTPGRVHDGMPFATYDKLDTHSCASVVEGGWWFNQCFNANLNRANVSELCWYAVDNSIVQSSTMMISKG